MNKKVILITGANSGFGQLAVNSCAELGHKIYATMRDIKGRNADKAKAFLQSGINVLELEASSKKTISDAVEAIIKKEGRIDVVVNNIGMYATGLAETFTGDDLETIININTIAPWRIIKSILPHMRKQGEGLIINISSVAGRFAFPFQMPYNSSKFALEGLTEGLHYELRPLGIDVVMIEPGAFPTEIWGKIFSGSDTPTAKEYGDLAKVPEQIGAGVKQMFDTVKPNPQLVADAITQLIDTPKGKRPLRTVVDIVSGKFSETANMQVKVQFDNFVKAFGMESMLA